MSVIARLQQLTSGWLLFRSEFQTAGILRAGQLPVIAVLGDTVVHKPQNAWSSLSVTNGSGTFSLTQRPTVSED
jgi:hypothetical protein